MTGDKDSIRVDAQESIRHRERPSLDSLSGTARFEGGPAAAAPTTALERLSAGV
jgi:hypothetical protein